MARPPRIVLVTADSTRREAWTTCLHKCVQFCDRRESPTETTGPEVVITDRLPVDDQLPACGSLLVRGEVGIVVVGLGGAADVSLPADHSARELRLACTLLAEIVRLRRRRSDDKRKQTALQELAFHDPLTHVGNRRMWETQSAASLESLAAGSGSDVQSGICVALFDLDHFKRVNDELGHIHGDEVLRRSAARLASQVRQTDLVARLGGDEFVALLSHLDAVSAAAVVERIRVGAAVELTRDDGTVRRITFSAGYIYLPPGSQTTGLAALQAADRFLAQAKSQGRDRTVGTPPIGP